MKDAHAKPRVPSRHKKRDEQTFRSFFSYSFLFFLLLVSFFFLNFKCFCISGALPIFLYMINTIMGMVDLSTPRARWVSMAASSADRRDRDSGEEPWGLEGHIEL